MKTISALLVVNDSDLCRRLCGVLEKNTRLQFESCSSAKKALEILHRRHFQILYADLHLDDISGVELTEQVKGHFPAMDILVGSAAGTAQDVIDAMRAGASEFIIDPFEPELIENAFGKSVRKCLASCDRGPVRRHASKAIITRDKAFLNLLGMARKVAPSTATIMVTGESGTGKEMLAAFIHANSSRRNEPYMAINCAALPEHLAESELFGHEKGAFTGAISRKIGKFESAGNGTLVLDEVTEMALPLQAKLLRAIQEREIMRIGGNRSIEIEARVVAISNQNMKKAVSSGSFREDLFYRLNVIPLTIPPLRERKNDIPLLADYFLKRFCSQNQKAMEGISDRAMSRLVAQPWPGNVRELENTIERGVLIGSGKELMPEDLILDETVLPASSPPSLAAGMTVREMEKELIFNTLDAVKENRTHAAKMLGISIRTLRNKLNEYRGEMDPPGA
ncbi:sigma-54-dependent Fis family transcriptional regulator [Desulfosarcina alkanivorans]|uniref:Sigma-54-dependent Fis family transcriptional regulator n=1 Tax=Desulfosarcina alkanivorans TaxID=571177 RepID=A0A5K7YKC9_9BACT|nr:sigma-54 dependent transcriptional regulator [Desulfosarcina alkanivorans]BBO66754.1 sigma-54-dependent Fis family transcriptional regulator [Desulfosarcina alkanivorans]